MRGVMGDPGGAWASGEGEGEAQEKTEDRRLGGKSAREGETVKEGRGRMMAGRGGEGRKGVRREGGEG